MRIFIAVVVLILSFQSWTRADDVRDFEIEGMSIGDSLLNYMDENLIKKAINNKDIAYYYEDDFVTISTWDIKEKFKIYNDVGIVLDPNDKKYKIFALQGTLYFKDKDIQKCYKKQNEISEDIKISLNLNNQGNTWFVLKKNLSKHQLSTKYIDFELGEGGIIRTTCYEIQEGIKKNSDYHLLSVVVNSPIFWNYLYTYYK